MALTKRFSPRPRKPGVAVAVIISLLGVMAASSVVLAAQGLLASAGPPPSETAIVTAVVSKGTIEDRFVGTVRFEPNTTISVVSPEISSDSDPVVTGAGIDSEAPVNLGDRIIEVAGRPVFAIEGSVPMWRTLALGSKGADVQQIQTSLQELGYTFRDANSVLGESTMKALRAMYRDGGYQMVDMGLQPAPDTSSVWSLMIPRGELVTVPSLPAILDTPCVPVGAQAELLCGLRSVDGKAVLVVPDYDAARVVQGQEVTIDMPGAAPIVGTVGPRLPQILTPTSTDSLEAQSPPTTKEARFELDLESPERADEIQGQNTSASILAARSPGESVIVPESAVAAGTDGKFWVMVQGAQPDDPVVRVEVRLGLCALGECEVTDPSPNLTAGTVLVLISG